MTRNRVGAMAAVALLSLAFGCDVTRTVTTTVDEAVHANGDIVVRGALLWRDGSEPRLCEELSVKPLRCSGASLAIAGEHEELLLRLEPRLQRGGGALWSRAIELEGSVDDGVLTLFAERA